jgi:allantoin racemase
MHMASLIATGFSVVTTLDRTRVIAAHLAESYGMARFCKAIRATEVAVLELEDKASQARRTILEECRRAVIEDRSGAVVLGCAGMADLAADIAAEIRVPVIEGVAAAVKLVESYRFERVMS